MSPEPTTPQIDPTTGLPAVEPTQPPFAPVPSEASPGQQTAPTPSPEQPPTTPAASQDNSSPTDTSTASQPSTPTDSGSTPETSSQRDTQPTGTSEPASGSEPSSPTSTPSVDEPGAPEQPQTPKLFILGAGAQDHGPWEVVAKFADLRVPADAAEHAYAALYTVDGDQAPAELELYEGPTEPLPLADGSIGRHQAAELTLVSPVPAAVIDGIVYRGRTDDDVLTGTFCRVIEGEYAGRYGVFTNTATITLDGWPATVIVRTRDDRDENITVNYADIRPAQPGGR